MPRRHGTEAASSGAVRAVVSGLEGRHALDRHRRSPGTGAPRSGTLGVDDPNHAANGSLGRANTDIDATNRTIGHANEKIGEANKKIGVIDQAIQKIPGLRQ